VRILAVANGSLLDNTTGEVMPASNLGFQVVHGDGGYLVGCNLYAHVSRLCEVFGEFPGWTVQIQSKEKRLLRGTGRIVIGSFLPIHFGFITPRDNRPSGSSRTQASRPGRLAQPRRGGGRSTARLFHCMDLTEIAGVKDVQLGEAMELAESILSLCEARGVRFSANRGGLASRLLKASPYWEKDRRAAPRFVNDHAREHLPGNYYGLGAVTNRTYKGAIYVDQVSSHHNVALTTPVPHPHYIRARGNYREADRAWIVDASKIRRFMESHYGLVAAKVDIAHIPNHLKHLYPPFMHTPGRRVEYLYTNELDYFDGHRANLDFLTAAWTAPIADPAVPEFASWALGQRNAGPGRKPLLLAAYGSLAQRSDRPLTMYLPWRGYGMRTMLPGAGFLNERTKEVRTDRPQARIVNVLARGIIEAETRKRSLAYARELHDQGVPVLSVYVDGLILDTDRLPFLPDGWEVEAHLTNLTFQHPNSWTSDEQSKQPGIPGRTTQAEQARKMMAAAQGIPVEARIRHAERQAERNRKASAALLRAARWRLRQDAA
jgi:hypothetical protein